uniref:hypothetical protein n=1 Tax=Paraprevotella xylaniphila TaxID=454155 RepID=UPI003FD81D1D
ASAKVQPFTITAKRLPIKTEKISTDEFYTLFNIIRTKNILIFFLFPIEYSTFAVDNQYVIIQ